MAKARFTGHDIGELADRCEARGTSRMLRDMRPPLLSPFGRYPHLRYTGSGTV
jgi:hypothetical protein